MFPQPEAKWFEFSATTDLLANALELKRPQLSQLTGFEFTQLTYIERYAGELGCRSFVIESPYIDRDYIEDHGVFYAKNLFPYPNSCRRVHFFSHSTSEVQTELTRVLSIGKTDGREKFQEACHQFSKDYYLGFSVIKPLAATPVGRTVLKCFPRQEEGKQFERRFTCIRQYTVHFAGCTLSVQGLAFQQQDVGVSACATTALWSALQKSSDDEPIAAMTPVQITQLATKYSLPSGRPLPSEGLNLEQICNAVQACGVSPNVFLVEHDAQMALRILRSAILSGFAPVLAIFNDQLGGHAITAVGLKESAPAAMHSPNFFEDSVIGLYAHDDRLGPNLKCDLIKSAVPNSPLEVHIQLRDKSITEQWQLKYIVVPMHAKIRLSLANLQSVAGEAYSTLLAIHKHYKLQEQGISSSPMSFDCRIMRGHHYLEQLLFEVGSLNADDVKVISFSVTVARYVGVVRVSGPFFPMFDIVLDTTGTIRNPNVLGIVLLYPRLTAANQVAALVAALIPCRLIGA